MSPIQEQRARWFKNSHTHGAKWMSNDLSGIATVAMQKDQFLALCATITAEAVAAERARLSAGVEVTDAEIDALWREAVRATMPLGKSPQKHFARALIAEASARATAAERERCATGRNKQRLPTDVSEKIRNGIRGAAHRTGEE